MPVSTHAARGRRLSRTHVATALIAALLCATTVHGTASAATNTTITALGVAPLFSGEWALSARAAIHVTLSRQARLSVTVLRPSGKVVRTLVRDLRFESGDHVLSWDWRNASGNLVRDGTYWLRVVAKNGLGTAEARRPFRKGLPQIYPAKPGAIVVALDPGHGGYRWGAYMAGEREKHFNLDIAHRLRVLLEASGVRVVMTRTTDTPVNEAEADVNGDGKVNRADDLAARNDIVNGARADLHLSIHNNASTCACRRGTEVFANMGRTWVDENLDLARLLQAEQLWALDQYRDSVYFPRDLGVRHGEYYVLNPYDALDLPRPSQAVGALTETLFVDNDLERAMLKRADVRQSIAIAFYIGVARYLNSRDYGLRYELLSGPSAAIQAGRDIEYKLRVTNRGNVASNGWRLELGAVPAVPLYDGSEQPGQPMGSAAIPDGLAPGESVDITLHGTAPSTAGDWLVKADVLLPTTERSRLSQRGVVSLQVALRTTD